MLNVAVLMGRFVADPELRQTPSGVSVTSFTLAVDRSYVKPGTERQADFIDIVAWRSTAEFVCKYFRKGQLAAVQGSIQTRTYTDKNGIKRKAFEIVADNVHFAESKRSADASVNAARSSSPAKQSASNEAPDKEQQPAPAYTNGNTDDFEEIPSDDDLPF
ncbi:MAG TPA: single-stranded DNA-binding protein [Ruminococcaceae bacterium]|jgi:single-strand DNA-binding protein|nr:single-stranded DNA-binding protein [Oscillospiraceae bacterium]